MSLEAALQENTEVMRELIGRLRAAGVMSSTAETMTGKQLVDKVDAGTKAETKTAETKKVEEVAEINYEKEVRPLLVKVSSTKGRDALVALLAQFDVTKGDQLKPSQLPKVLAAANELLAA